MKPLNVLCAYPYMKKGVVNLLKEFDQDHPDSIRLFVDSGAFTAHNAGKEITLDGYCQFLESLPVKPWKYIALDVIGDPEGTARNYEEMIKRGFDPVPVFTHGQDYADIDSLYSKAEFICLGGIVPLTMKEKVWAVKQLIDHTDKKLHLLGFTSIKYIKHFKPFSCDSSSWNGGLRFGGADLYLGHGKMRKIKKQEFQRRPSEQVLSRIKQLGVDPYEGRSSDMWRGGTNFIGKLGAASWLQMSFDIETNLGTKMFLAFSTDSQFGLIINAYKNLIRSGL